MCYMTCQELRLYFEDPLRSDAELLVEAEHLVRCPECARLVEAQRELGAGLRLTRDAVLPFPASLDEVVLSNYRDYIAKSGAPTISPSRRRRVALLCWAAAAAALILLSATLLLERRTPIITAHPQSSPVIAPVAEASPNAVAEVPRQIKRKAPQRARPETTAAASVPGSLPVGFRSLMYCDELSCGGAMDVIRVQLPASTAALAPALSSGGPVFADVLVGSDGIARGIRVVE
jgi:hypothetical protein